MQRLIINTLTVLANLPMVRQVVKCKDFLVNKGKRTRPVLILLFIGMSLFTFFLSWQENGLLRHEAYSALTIFSMLIFLSLLSPSNRVNDN